MKSAPKYKSGTLKSYTLIIYIHDFFFKYSAYSLIRTHWTRFFCKHVKLQKSFFSYNNITAAFKRK